MKVLMLRPLIEAAGAGKYIRILTEELMDLGCEVFIVCAGGDGLLEYPGDVPVIISQALYPSTLPNLTLSLRNILRICQTYQIDIIHSHHRFTSVVAGIAGWFSGIPYVVTIHEYKQDWRFLSGLWKGKTTISPTYALKETLINHYGVNPDRIEVIPTGLKPPVLDSHRITEFRDTILGDHQILIGYVGRLSPEKGVNHFIEAAALVITQHPEARFVIVGDGPSRDALESLARKHNIQPESLVFMGYRSNISEIMAGLDLLVIPSLTDNLPLVALEAMSLARPIIATKVGGLPELIREGVNGILVEPGSSEELAKAITDAIGNPMDRERMGNAGNSIFWRDHQIRNMAERILGVYHRHVNPMGAG